MIKSINSAWEQGKDEEEPLEERYVWKDQEKGNDPKGLLILVPFYILCL